MYTAKPHSDILGEIGTEYLLYIFKKPLTFFAASAEGIVGASNSGKRTPVEQVISKDEPMAMFFLIL